MWVFSQWWSGRLCVFNFSTEPKQEAIQRCSVLCRLMLLGHFCLHLDSRLLSAASHHPKSSPCSPIFFFSLAFLTSVWSPISSNLGFKNPSVQALFTNYWPFVFTGTVKYLACSNLLDFILLSLFLCHLELQYLLWLSIYLLVCFLQGSLSFLEETPSSMGSNPSLSKQCCWY